MPKRVQLKRTNGWRMPPNCVKVTRPGPWGNPFKVGGKNKDALEPYQAVNLFECYAKNRLNVEPTWLEPLRGKDLACWCSADGCNPCHADVLLELANKGTA